MKRWIVIGAGYTGTRLAQRLSRAGQAVVVTRRSAARAQKVASQIGVDVSSAHVDLLEPDSLEDVLCQGAVVVDSAPPSDGVAPESALVRACARARVSRLVYLSSTGVYPRGNGGRVTEETAAQPFGRLGQRRWSAECAILQEARSHGVSAVSLRIAGIYGPGRGVAARIAAGTYRVLGSGATLTSRIHVHDLVSAIIAAGEIDPLPYEVINVADDVPTESRFLADRVAEMLGVPSPPSAEPESVSPAALELLTSDRHIVNDRLKEIGVKLRYPSWREGMAAVLAEMSR